MRYATKRKLKNAYNNWKCSSCGEIFRTRALLKQHRKECCTYDHSQGQLSTKKTYCCKFCGKEWLTTKSGLGKHERYCKSNPNAVSCIGHSVSEETKKKLREKCGGYRKNAGRGRRGYYKGLYCMSSWELAWVVYQLEHDKQVEQCKEKFEYMMNGEIHHYTPDFKIGDIYFEIKNWHRPDTDFKISAFPKEKTLILIEGKQNEKYISYVTEKYGKNFTDVLYERNLDS